MKRSLWFCLPLILILSGCVHNSPFVDSDEYFFQAMGKDSEIVITADTEKLKEKKPELFETGSGVLDEMFDRSTRFSISFYKDVYSESDPYPADLSSFDFYGGLEGNYGSFTINTALSWSKAFHKEKQDGVKYYTDDGGTISLAVPESGLLLFASDDYVQAYLDTVKERFIHIPDDTARLMGESLMGIYVRSPRTMIYLGFELPYSVLAQMEDAVLYIVEKDGVYYLNADIRMQSGSLATTLQTLLRNQVVGELRRQGLRPDYTVLGRQYLSDGELVMVRDFELSDEQFDSFSGRIASISGGFF